MSDVRSLLQTRKICIEGFMSQRLEDGQWRKAWFVLDSSGSSLRGYPRRPGENDVPTVEISLEEVHQVSKGGLAEPPRDLKRSQKVPQIPKEKEFSFRLCDASGREEIAYFRCADKSTLLWWMHGFQRRIFEQTKGILRKNKKMAADLSLISGADDRKVQTMPRSMTISGIQHRPRSGSSAQREWLTVTTGAVQGRRKNMEDETLIELDLNEKMNLNAEEHGKLALLAVFDGHAGRECAEYACEFLVENLISQPAFKEHNLEVALREAFLQTDAEFRAWAMENDNISGSTGLVVLFRNKDLYVANSGDCRAVLCRAGVATNLSVDHKPDRPDEQLRIEEAGGWIDSRDVLNIPKLYALGLEHTELLDEHHELIGWVTVHKVCGALAMTRSLGDCLIKDKLSETFESCYEEGFMGPLILAEPEIQVDRVRPEDEFLIIACDGLWDVFTSQAAVDFVLGHLDTQVPREAIVDKLISRALELGTLDNVSAVIVFFSHS